MERINELARKKKSGFLTDDEQREQMELREEYLRVFRGEFRRQLDSIEIVDDPNDSLKH